MPHKVAFQYILKVAVAHPRSLYHCSSKQSRLTKKTQSVAS